MDRSPYTRGQYTSEFNFERNKISELFEDSRGIVWVGFKNEGINKTISLDDGLNTIFLHQGAED